jgi:hypothetical protein
MRKHSVWTDDKDPKVPLKIKKVGNWVYNLLLKAVVESNVFLTLI